MYDDGQGIIGAAVDNNEKKSIRKMRWERFSLLNNENFTNS